MMYLAEWNGMEWIGLDWNGMEWNGMEWIGMRWETHHRVHTRRPIARSRVSKTNKNERRETHHRTHARRPIARSRVSSMPVRMMTPR